MTRDSIARLRQPLTVVAVWTAYALALAASYQHVRTAFGALEATPGGWTAYAAAAAVEVGLAALALALVARRRTGARDGRLWAGLAAMAVVSALANADAALTALGGGQRPLWAAGLTIDPLDVARAIIGAGALPALVLFLAAAAETLTADAASAAAPALEADADDVADALAGAAATLEAAAGDDAGDDAAGLEGADAAALEAAAAPLRTAARRRRGPHAPDLAPAAGPLPAPLTRRTADTLNRLLDAATADPAATIDALAGRLEVSPDTIRRAIARGRALGLLERRGGLWYAADDRVAPAVGRPPYRSAATIAPAPDVTG